ncbi:MAG: hypothetical protein GY842_09920 [bacterium]|nr:hypothetical protein [bacterium]
MSTYSLSKACAGLVLLAVLSACASSGPPPPPTLERTGESIIRYTGPEIAVVVSYTFATANLGEPWLMLATSFSGGSRRGAEVKREGIFVRTPVGERIALATQKELVNASGEAGSVVRRAEVASEPLTYMGGDRKRCRVPFFVTTKQVLRGYSIADSFYVSSRDLCSGPLYFPVAGGVQPGGWLLEIELKENVVRIPFVLGEQQ